MAQAGSVSGADRSLAHSWHLLLWPSTVERIRELPGVLYKGTNSILEVSTLRT